MIYCNQHSFFDLLVLNEALIINELITWQWMATAEIQYITVDMNEFSTVQPRALETPEQSPDYRWLLPENIKRPKSQMMTMIYGVRSTKPPSKSHLWLVFCYGASYRTVINSSSLGIILWVPVHVEVYAMGLRRMLQETYMRCSFLSHGLGRWSLLISYSIAIVSDGENSASQRHQTAVHQVSTGL